MKLHPRNKHRERYSFDLLIAGTPELKKYVAPNKFGDHSVDFFNPEAVKMLNQALLKTYYNLSFWDIPPNYLCPPTPGRADYIHYVADLLAKNNKGKIPNGEQIRCLDIGTGANMVYPIIGSHEYGWSFVGSDIDSISIDSAKNILDQNDTISGLIELRHQKNKNYIFRNIINNGEHFDLTICNPPFHASAEEAVKGTQRKLRNLKQKKKFKTVLNFSGQQNELWCEGGEKKFVRDMIFESKEFANSCTWFTTLISKKDNLQNANQALKSVSAKRIETIEMEQGNKISRIIAWSF